MTNTVKLIQKRRELNQERISKKMALLFKSISTAKKIYMDLGYLAQKILSTENTVWKYIRKLWL